MSMSKNSNMLQYINYRMRVTIQDGRQFIGKFMAFDSHMNLVLGDCEEFRKLPATKGSIEEREDCRTLVIFMTVEGPPPPDDSGVKATTGSVSAVHGPGLGRAAGRGVPMGPMVQAQPGLAGPVRRVGGPAAGMMQPLRPGMPGGQPHPGMPPPPPGGQVPVFGPPGAGLIVPEIQDDGKVRVDMGEPILKASDVPTKLPPNRDQSVVKSRLDVDGRAWNVTCVSMGNPHCVTFSTEQSQDLQVDELNLPDIGPKFEHHEMFPARTNTEFVQVFSPTHLKMRVWERGAGETLACGTGACAVVVAAVLEGRAARRCTVDLPGGPLDIEWSEKDNHIYMTGPAEVVFYGSVPL